MAFLLLRPHLQRAYPESKTLPSVDAVREWQATYEKHVVQLRALPFMRSDRREAELRLDEQRAWLQKQELAWSPPPHLSVWGTPVPQTFYTAAAGDHDT